MKAKNPDYEAVIRASFARQSMMVTLGARLDRVAPGAVDITVPITDALRQQHGFAHGGLAFAVGDSAAGYSALSLQPEGFEVLTIEMKINYLAPATDGDLVAKGRVIKPGRTVVVVGADVFCGEVHIAALQGSMIVKAP